jgi:hypothetical protein
MLHYFMVCGVKSLIDHGSYQYTHALVLLSFLLHDEHGKVVVTEKHCWQKLLALHDSMMTYL